MEELINELIALVKNTAPELWRIAKRQVTYQVAISAIWFVISLVITVGGFRLVAKGNKALEEDSYTDDHILPYTIAGVLFTIAIIAFPISMDMLLSRLINPEYYAIQVLMDLVK